MWIEILISHLCEYVDSGKSRVKYKSRKSDKYNISSKKCDLYLSYNNTTGEVRDKLKEFEIHLEKKFVTRKNITCNLTVVLYCSTGDTSLICCKWKCIALIRLVELNKIDAKPGETHIWKLFCFYWNENGCIILKYFELLSTNANASNKETEITSFVR